MDGTEFDIHVQKFSLAVLIFEILPNEHWCRMHLKLRNFIALRAENFQIEFEHTLSLRVY